MVPSYMDRSSDELWRKTVVVTKGRSGNQNYRKNLHRVLTACSRVIASLYVELSPRDLAILGNPSVQY